MYWCKSVLLLVVMVVCITAMTSAFRCYKCDHYYRDPGCDPFDKSKVNITVCPGFNRVAACLKTIREGKGNETITAVYTTAIITCMC